MTAPASAVVVRGLEMTRGARRVLAGVDFEIGCGEVVALMGASGSGKTTILRVLAGLEPFESGAVRVDGVTVPEGSAQPRALHELRRKVGMVFQFHCLFEHLSAAENVALALVHVHRVAPAEAQRRAAELLELLGVQHRGAALPREFDILSGDDGLTVPFMKEGAVGVVSVASNIIPREVCDLVAAGLSRRWDDAQKLHDRYNDLFTNLFIEPNPAPTKQALAWQGRMTADVRLPLCELQPASQDKLRATLKALNLI